MYKYPSHLYKFFKLKLKVFYSLLNLNSCHSYLYYFYYLILLYIMYGMDGLNMESLGVGLCRHIYTSFACVKILI